MIAERRLSVDENDAQAYGLLGLVAKAEGDQKKAEDFWESSALRWKQLPVPVCSVS